MIFVNQFHLIFKKLSILDGSFISMKSIKNLGSEKFCRRNFKFLRRSFFFVTKIDLGLKANALRTTTEAIGDFSSIFFHMATTQERTLLRKLVTTFLLTKSFLYSALNLFSTAKPRLNSFFFCKHFPCPNQSFGDLGLTCSHL